MFMATIETVTNVEIGDRSETDKQELVHAYGGLKVALHLIYPLISSKPLHESPQTLLIASRDKKDTDPDYFEGHNFLVRLRLAALPLLKDLWEATWLVPAPLPVVKSVVQAVMELTGAENEEPKDEASGEVVGGPSPASAPRSAGPDENRIRQVTDMGFPRSAAERALARTHNNVSAATELLLSQPFPFPPDREANDPLSDVEASEEPSDETPPPNGERTAAADSEEDMQIGSSIAGPSSSGDDGPLAEPVASQEAGKSSEQWRKDLDEARKQLKAGMSKKALRLVDQHPSLIFDVYNTFTRPSDGLQEQSVRHLVDDIKAFSPFAHDVREEPLAMRCRLLALVLTDAPSALTQDIGGNLMDSLLALILSNPLSTEAEQPSVPKWLASHLLVTESLLTMGEQPRTIILPKENDPIVSESIAAGPPFLESRAIMFDFCLRLLAIPDLPRDDLLAVLRLFVLLTRDHSVACQFVQRDGIALLFGRLKSAPVSGSQLYIALILRHVIEGPSVLQNIMKQEIKRFFAQPRTRIIDVGSYVRHCNPMALRDPETFIHVTQSLCQLQHPYASIHHVSLKSEATSKPAEEIKEGIDSSDMQVDVSSTSNPMDAASTETLETVVHFLVSELMRTAKTSFESAPSSVSPWQPQDASASKDEVIMDERTNGKGLSDSTDEAREHDRQIYSCFLMQCLTELLFSYDSCKIAFLSYSPKKRSQTPAKDGGTKHRTATLQFLLSELVSYGTLNPQPDSASRNRHSLCNWAMSVIVALCVDSSSGSEVKDVTPDLISVRKFVLEAVSRAIKELSPSESLDSRYGRLFALSDLCHRLLIVRFNAVARKPQDETPTHIAKVMLEKNFVSTLTNALAEVDLNYPNVRSLVAAILRPLEHL
jgi:E3 ubiquitin-protein ligase HUWE1